MDSKSTPYDIQLGRELMRDVKQALTKQEGKWPKEYHAMEWRDMNMQPPAKGWQEMDGNQRFNLLCDCLDEAVWGLERQDAEKMASEFVNGYDQQLDDLSHRGSGQTPDKDRGR